MSEEMGKQERHKRGFYQVIWQELFGGISMKARDKKILIVGFMGGFITGVVISMVMVLISTAIS